MNIITSRATHGRTTSVRYRLALREMMIEIRTLVAEGRNNGTLADPHACTQRALDMLRSPNRSGTRSILRNS